MTDTMREWTAKVGSDLDQLPLGEDQHAALLAEEVVMLSLEDTAWELRLVSQDGVRWLLVQDVTDREANRAGLLAAARCRWLGSTAATLAHDLNNQFNAALALSATLKYVVDNDSDRKTITELESGTKVGLRMVRALARMLVGRGNIRDLIEPAEVLEDALSMVRKSLHLASIDLQVEVAEELPLIRAVHIEAVQAVLHGLVALQMLAPKQIRCVLSSDLLAVGGGRQRPCIVLSCHADGVSGAHVEGVVAVVQLHDGKWDHVRQSPDQLESLANCVFMLQSLGGDLRAASEGDSLRLDYIWPSVT